MEYQFDFDFPAVVEVVKKNYTLNESQGDSILRHLCEGGDFTQWGLANAVTRTANDEESYEHATNLERIGGKIIELSPKDWKVISEKVA